MHQVIKNIKQLINILIGFVILTGCYYAGKYLSTLSGNLLSGSVIGMLLLFLLLCTGLVKKGQVQPVADFFLANLILFFIPALVAVTLIDFGSLWKELPGIILIAAVTTIVVMASTGLFVQWREQSNASRGGIISHKAGSSGTKRISR